MDRGAWWATVHRVAESRTRLSDQTHTHNKFDPREHITLPQSEYKGRTHGFDVGIEL